MKFEDELRQALTRDPAPPEFRRKLMARLPARRGAFGGRPRPALIAIAAVVLLAALIPAREVVRGIRARNQLLTALSLTQNTLRHTRKMIHRATRHS